MRMAYHLRNLLIEAILCHQLLQSHMHTVAPIVAGIRRHVNALGIGILQTQVLVDREPILQSQDAQQRWRVKVLAYNLLTN